MTQVSNIHTNMMGTISFSAKFQGMRKPQKFVVYPNPENGKLLVQADTKCGYIDTTNGKYLIASCEFPLQIATSKKNIGTIENLQELRDAARCTASDKAGQSYVYCDNSTAANI